MGVLAYAAARTLDGDRAQQQVVLGDGAGWMKGQAALHFPDAITILDWAHLARTVHRAIPEARPGTANWGLRLELHAAIPEMRWHGDVVAACALLAALRPEGEPCPSLEEALRYLKTQAA